MESMRRMLPEVTRVQIEVSLHKGTAEVEGFRLFEELIKKFKKCLAEVYPDNVISHSVARGVDEGGWLLHLGLEVFDEEVDLVDRFVWHSKGKRFLLRVKTEQFYDFRGEELRPYEGGQNERKGKGLVSRWGAPGEERVS